MNDHSKEQKTYDYPVDTNGDFQAGEVSDNADHLQRRLGNRQIQLIAIGGSIGTALFVSIGGGLNKGGPAGLLLAYFFYSCLLGLINNSMAEMTTLMPVSGGFIRLAGKWVDEACEIKPLLFATIADSTNRPKATSSFLLARKKCFFHVLGVNTEQNSHII